MWRALVALAALGARADFDDEPEVTAEAHQLTVAAYFQKREYWVTSNLGSILFKNQMPRTEPRNETFLVYVHELERNRLLSFGAAGVLQHPLERCSVQNCVFSSWAGALEAAAAVVAPWWAPPARRASRDQRWVFVLDAPPRAPLPPGRLAALAGLYNWSMTYRSDADVPVPFGRVTARPAAATRWAWAGAARLVPHWRRKQRAVLAAARVAGCAAPRPARYLRALEHHLPLHVYGDCGKHPGPNTILCSDKECSEIDTYMFHLAFEESECQQYITAKVFEESFARGAIPVIVGASLEECAALLPPDSFLHVDNYSSVRALAADMRAIGGEATRALRYHAWRNHFEVAEERGAALCRLCQALNYNLREERVYDEFELGLFLDPAATCRYNYI